MAVETSIQPSTSLSNDEILRYSRHLIMPEVAWKANLNLRMQKF